MKKLILATVIILSIARSAQAQQWTTNVNDISNVNSGNVGIGTTVLNGKFTIYQNLPLGTAIGNNTLLVSASGSSTANTFKSNLWLVRNAAGSDWTTARLHDGIGIDNSFLTPRTNTKTWWERDPFNNIQSWGDATNTYLTINKGNVGIGGNNPTSGLVVQQEGGNTTDGALFLVNGVNASFGGFATLAGIKTIAGDGGQYNFLKIQNAAGVKFLINGSGNVGIGTSDTKGNKLAVNGSVIATEVTVQPYGSWPDYVFKKDYQLRSLNEVKAYIDQNQHLPEIPSAEEIEKDGLKLGDMNTLLMKKVEELTLYLIEKDRREEEQRKTIQSIKQQLDHLTKQLKALKPVIANRR